MNDYAKALMAGYRQRGLLLDANLLLLFFIGSYDRELIPRLSRLDNFTQDDYDQIAEIVGHFVKTITTPNILTEVSNLSTNAVYNNLHDSYLPHFAAGIQLLVEEYVPSGAAAQLPIFNRLALTDAGIEQVARDKYLVMTIDLNLYVHLEAQGIGVVNYNHIRDLEWR